MAGKFILKLCTFRSTEKAWSEGMANWIPSLSMQKLKNHSGEASRASNRTKDITPPVSKSQSKVHLLLPSCQT